MKSAHMMLHMKNFLPFEVWAETVNIVYVLNLITVSPSSEMWMGEEDKYRTLIDLQGIRPCAKIVHEETSLSHETLPYIRYLCLCA